MIKFKFYLKDRETKEGNQVYAKFYDSNNTSANVRIGLKTRIYIDCWNKDDQVAFTNKIYNKEEVDAINKSLTNFKNQIAKIISTLELRGDVVTSEKVKKLFETDMEDLKIEVEKENKIYKYIDEYYEGYSKKFHYRSSPHIGFKSFKRFEIATKKRRIKDISYGLIKEYAEWLRDAGKEDSTINQRINKLKAFIKVELKYTTKIDHSYEKYCHKFKTAEIFRLTIDQFNTFFLIDKLEKRLNDIKDAFVLMVCFGGIRISSALELDNDSVNRVEQKATYLEMKIVANKPQKKSITNPLTQYALHILKQRNWKLPTIIQSQHFNDGLKEIIANSKLKDEMFIVDESDKKNVRKYLREEISSKVARKTFVSINEDFGISRAVSNTMSNHSSKSGNASDYYRLSDQKYLWQKKLEVAERWNLEYYKLFPEALTNENKQVFKLANGKKLVVYNNQIVSTL